MLSRAPVLSFLKIFPPPPPPFLSSLPFSKSKTLNPYALLRLSSAGRTAMSARRTVAEALMGGARAAAARKKAKNDKPPAPSPPPDPSPPRPKPAKTLDTPPDEKKKNAALELRKKCSDFDPRAAAYWKDGEPVPFSFLVHAWELIGKESGRIAMTEILCNAFRTVIATTPGDLLATVYLTANKIAPPHEGLELGIGEASVVKALAEAYGRKEEHVKKQNNVSRWNLRHLSIVFC